MSAVHHVNGGGRDTERPEATGDGTHPAYRRLARATRQDPEWPSGGRDTQDGRTAHRVEVCPSCGALPSCCHCGSDVDDLRMFARRMAELHQRTTGPGCGCGARRCYVRTRLDGIGPAER